MYYIYSMNGIKNISRLPLDIAPTFELAIKKANALKKKYFGYYYITHVKKY